MPYKSEKQRKWMHANKPGMAAEWDKKEKQKNYAKELRKSASNQGGAAIGGGS